MRLAWLVTLVAAVVLAGAWRFWPRRPDTNGAAFLSSMVRMKCEETGKTWEERRGVVEAELRGMAGQVGEGARVSSPLAEGRATGVMADEGEWKRTIERINREKQEVTRGR